MPAIVHLQVRSVLEVIFIIVLFFVLGPEQTLLSAV